MGLLARLLRQAGDVQALTTTHITSNVNVKVPADRAAAVREALEAWLHEKGWAASVQTGPAGDYVAMHIRHESDSLGPPPSFDMSAELQKVLEDVLKTPRG
jgi:hypothetical protein